MCGNNNPFDLNPDILSSFINGKLAIFAGAGISTEGNDIVGYTFYDEILSEMDASSRDLEFPDLISAFCAQPNGRLKFIEKITDRFQNIKSTPEFYWLSTRFHREIAPISTIDTIITTNWDSFFEQECWATPFVFSEDTAFWDAAKRKVLKIHGTIENLGSIIASREDYEKCKDRLSKDLIGSRLKTILSEKTVIFCGYSLKDFDFQEIMRFVQTEMRGFQRQAYVVTLDNSEEAKARFSEFSVVPIITDGTHFIQRLKEEWHKLDYVANDSLYADCSVLLDIVREEHILLSGTINMFDSPYVIYSLFYQDGLIHALERICLLRKTGEYSNRHITGHKVHNYEEMKKKAIRLKKYDDAAYIEGYQAGLLYSIINKEDPENTPPLYFCFAKNSIYGIDEFQEIIANQGLLHKPSLKKAVSIVNKYERTDKFVLDHSCRLFGL